MGGGCCGNEGNEMPFEHGGHGDGMDMGMDGCGMVMYFHHRIKEQLPFKDWIPGTMGEYVQALFILFFATIAYEFMHTMRAILERYWWWQKRVAPTLTKAGTSCCQDKSKGSASLETSADTKGKGTEELLDASGCPCHAPVEPSTPVLKGSDSALVEVEGASGGGSGSKIRASLFFRFLWFVLPKDARPFLAGGVVTDEMPTKGSNDYPSFYLGHDLPRALLHALEATVGYVLMLIAMTYNYGYFFAVIAGFFVGSLLFGRFRAYKPSCCA